jgi:tRNA-2-methylthio-N6-dimethylallyladenosine synthase
MDKKAYILTFGCQMNEYDSEVLESILSTNGYLITDQPEKADLAVVNTCSVRQKAENRAMAHISQIAALKKSKPSMRVVVAGCMAKRAGQSILDEIPGVDYIVGPDYVSDIPEIITGDEPVFTDEKPVITSQHSLKFSKKVTSYLAISRGCENFCSYCIVPYVRGSFRSRPVNDIMAEMKMLVDSGVKDITLLGQNVNSYNDDDTDFPNLLCKLAPIAPSRLRFLTSHPKDLSDDLIRCFSDIPNLCQSLHLPLQSGSDKILKAMNRGYTLKHYLGLVEKLRNTAPDIALTTDLIVGFPGETHDDFQKTLKAVKDIVFDWAFMFRYSVRPKTAAARLPDDVPEDVKIDRLNNLIELQMTISGRKNTHWIGQTIEVLIEGQSRRQPFMPKGKSRGGQSVLITDNHQLKPGDLVMAKINSANAKTLLASFEKLA